MEAEETTHVRLRCPPLMLKYKNGNKQIVHKNNVELTMTPYQQGPIGTYFTVLNDDVPYLNWRIGACRCSEDLR